MSAGAPDPAPRLTAKGRATRDRIVRAAAELVFAQGAAGTSIDDVRRAADVSGSQISHYFADKEALLRAVVHYEAGRIIEEQSPIIDHLDSFEALRAWADGAIAKQRAIDCKGGCSYGSLASELAGRGEGMRAELEAGFVTWRGKIEQGLRLMHERGELRPEADPDQLALAVLAALQGGLLLTETMRDTAPLEAAMDASLAHVRSFAAVAPGAAA